MPSTSAPLFPYSGGKATINVEDSCTLYAVWTRTVTFYSGLNKAKAGTVTQYFTGALLAKPLYRAALGQLIYAVEGVENYHLLSPTVDVAASGTVLPVLGTVTVTHIGEE